ncbi:MAG: 4Fe-4S dicluster domain-containing protein [Gammaproteobacteria bacterium]|nr:4Fe-4S dicluster domain-containing protein [Gammaproteobacteria bacterium]NNJ50615.1 4Fe-4S dicluster domain-containing protein [Gammaproteobacteria bacterium]
MTDSTNKSAVDNSRRDFLSKAAVAGTITIAPGVLLHRTAQASASSGSHDGAVSSKNRWGMLIDTSKCANGCTACVDACNEENGLVGNGRPETDTQYIRKVTLKNKATGHETSLPLMCQHCETAPCADVCPTGASFVRADGIALVDKHICIGCRYCMMACPYKARSFVHESVQNQKLTAPRGKGTVESCTMCVTRVDNGGIPACVEACTEDNHNALMFGDLNDANSEISIALRERGGKQLRPDLALNTGVRYQGLNE